MIHKDTNQSWSIKTSTDELLNFIIFTGCMYNLIDDKNFDKSNTPWPTNLLNLDFEDLNYGNLKSQWKLWFNDTLEEKCNNVNTDKYICLLKKSIM